MFLILLPDELVDQLLHVAATQLGEAVVAELVVDVLLEVGLVRADHGGLVAPLALAGANFAAAHPGDERLAGLADRLAVRRLHRAPANGAGGIRSPTLRRRLRRERLADLFLLARTPDPRLPAVAALADSGWCLRHLPPPLG
jgi:hypothetical protein